MRRHPVSNLHPPFCLPNHGWLPPAWVKGKNAEVITRYKNAILRRRHRWSEEPKLDWPPEFSGPEINIQTKPFKLMRTAETPILILSQKAKAGNKDAALELARLALMATAQLARVSEKYPNFLSPLARGAMAWPVLKMRKDRLTKKEKRTFDAIGLGQNAFIELDPATSKYKWDDACRIAYLLLDYLHRARNSGKLSTFSYGSLGKAAKKLRAFNNESRAEWWELAKKTLLLSYPEPEKVEEFNRLVNGTSKRKSPGRIRQAIFDILKARVFSLSPNPYPS